MKVMEKISREEIEELNKDQLECFWDETARYTEVLAESNATCEKRSAELLAYAMRISGKFPGVVLDVGASIGNNAPLLSDVLCMVDEDYHGIDILAESIRGEFPGIRTGYLEDLGEDDTEKYDYVFASHVMEHCQDPAEAVRAAIRVTKIGGVIGQITPAPLAITPQHRNYLLLEEWKEEYIEAGAIPVLSFEADPGLEFVSLEPLRFFYLVVRRIR